MPQDIARQWFVPGEGIDRHVISADIQRYLGNDATVRPGVGTGENQGVTGYWIKAYRNLTSAMIADLRADSVRWRQEQRQTGTGESYVGSNTYNFSSAASMSQQRREGGESPSLDGPYGLPSSSRDRIPVDNRMQVDPPPSGRGGPYPPDGRSPAQYPPENRGFPSENRGFPPENRGFPPENRGYPPGSSRSQYPPDTPMTGFGGRPPVSAPYGQEPRYAPSYPSQGNDGVPPGYVRQGAYYAPVSGYEPSPSMPARVDNYGPDAYGGQTSGNRDPRYPPLEHPQDPRYGYPSPAATVSSVSVRDREPVPNPQQPSNYGPGSMPPQQYSPYNGGGMPVPSSVPTNPPRTGGPGGFPRPGTTPGSSSRTGGRR